STLPSENPHKNAQQAVRFDFDQPGNLSVFASGRTAPLLYAHASAGRAHAVRFLSPPVPPGAVDSERTTVNIRGKRRAALKFGHLPLNALGDAKGVSLYQPQYS